MTLIEFFILLMTGLLAGFISGSLGVGGGIVIVPSLVFLLGLTQHQAQGTSLALLLAPIGILAVINYHRDGFINWKFAFILMIAFVMGGYLGSKLSVQLPEKTLKQIFGLLMLIVGTKMILGK